MQADKGTCRYNPIFATTWDYEVVPINDFVIETPVAELSEETEEEKEKYQLDMWLDGDPDWRNVF